LAKETLRGQAGSNRLKMLARVKCSRAIASGMKQICDNHIVLCPVHAHVLARVRDVNFETLAESGHRVFRLEKGQASSTISDQPTPSAVKSVGACGGERDPGAESEEERPFGIRME
jgi:hypothetical protein